MKPVLIFCGVLCVLFFLPSNAADPQQSYPFYVVVGAFANEKNAVNFTRSIKPRFAEATYKRNAVRGLFYVFVQRTPVKPPAVELALQLQKQPAFHDAWVYSGPLEGEPIIRSGEPAVDLDPSSGETLPGVSLRDRVTFNESSTTGPVSISEAEPEEDSVQGGEVNAGKVFFRLYRASDNRKVEGTVSLVDVDRSRKYATVDANTYVKIPSPNNRSGRVLLVCDVFGYRQATEAYNAQDPSGFEQDETGAMVIPFGLVRLQKGDISVMYRVLFFNDAAIMRPESEVELQDLLDMMNENSRYRIRIHGHTNGTKGGKIISMGRDDAFFTLVDAKDGRGSAKKLSQRRAEVVRDYLVAHGVDEDRMEIKAWGGKLPLYDKNSSRAQENVRVEVEILEN